MRPGGLRWCPYLVHHLRFADRLGVLKGKGVSQIQQFAINLLLLMEGYEAAEHSQRDLKLALISFDPERFSPLLLSQTQRDNPLPPISNIEADEDLSDTAGVWDFSQADVMSPEEVAAILSNGKTEHTVKMALPPSDDDWNEW